MRKLTIQTLLYTAPHYYSLILPFIGGSYFQRLLLELHCRPASILAQKFLIEALYINQITLNNIFLSLKY